MKKIIYTWQEFDDDCKKLARIYGSYEGLIRNIYGIGRGGLFVAIRLSYLLDIPIITEKKLISRKTLIVNDIFDDEKESKKILSSKGYFSMATLWKTEKQRENPIVYQNILNSNNEHIQFIWETKKLSRKLNG